MVKVAVIGGGASGMMAAISAAAHGARVSLYEKNDRVGKKIRVTGNGKCNFSNRSFSPDKYNGTYKDRLSSVFQVFGVEDTVALFKREGMLVKEKNGYLYPYSEQASTVLDILRLQLTEKGVDLRLSSPVERIVKKAKGSGFLIRTAGTEEAFDRVILCCGGAAAPQTGSDGNGYILARQLGHAVVDCVPALVPLVCSDRFLPGVAGVRCEALIRLRKQKGLTGLPAQGGAAAGRPWAGENATVEPFGETLQEEWGELQFTDYGISGIPVFQLSRRAALLLKEGGKPEAAIDLFPGCSEKEYEALCQERLRSVNANARKGRTLEEFLLGMAHKKINQTLLRLSGLHPLDPVQEIPKARLRELLMSYRRLLVHITGTKPFANAQVTAGGVDLREVDKTMESLRVPGLYFAGELLDVDGRCGGYNLQWAWTSGYVAGRNAAGGNPADRDVDRKHRVYRQDKKQGRETG